MFDMSANEQFVYDLFKDEPHTWFDNNKNCFVISNDPKTGYIRFYGDDLMELEVYTDKSIPDFYLQFALVSRTSARGYFQTFFAYLLDDLKNEENKEVHYVHANKILFTCSCGASSRFFANSLQEKVDPEKKDMVFDAISYEFLDDVHQDYDLIVLMPQINYKKKEFKEKYGNDKVITVNTHDFATRNFDNVLNQILTAS